MHDEIKKLEDKIRLRPEGQRSIKREDILAHVKGWTRYKRRQFYRALIEKYQPKKELPSDPYKPDISHPQEEAKQTTMSLNSSSTKLRNTYQVPAGKTVSVDTPSGQKKYRGGQFVPPEELGKAHEESSSGRGKGQQAKGGQNDDGQPQWAEIVQNFKTIDISSSDALNKGSYLLQQFLPFPVTTSSKQIAPLTKFAAELALANFTNSIPGVKDLLTEAGTSINLYAPNDRPATKDEIAGQEFNKLGHLDLSHNEISLWQNRVKVPETFYQVTEFISHKLALLTIHLLLNKLDNADATISKLTENEEHNTQILNSLLSHYQNNPKKAAQDPNIQQLQQTLQSLTIEKESLSQLNTVITSLKSAITKEGSDDEHIDELITSNGIEAMIFQTAKVFQLANSFSLGQNKTFDNALELLAAKKPDTLAGVKNLIDYLNAVAQMKEQLNNPQEEE